MFNAWMTFFFERIPFTNYLLISLGFAFSAPALASSHEKTATPMLFFSTFITFFCLCLLRLMGDIKDFDKDLTINTTHPLARGFISKKNATLVALWSTGVLLLFSIIFMLTGHFCSGFFLLLLTLYMVAMFKEFYFDKLKDYSLAYALSRELILWPLCAFTLAMANGFSFALATAQTIMMLGCFFCYEISCKLSPDAHSTLSYYRNIYGLNKALAIAAAGLFLACLGSLLLGVAGITAVFELATLGSLLFIYKKPEHYKYAEPTAGLSLLIHALAPVLIY